MGMTMAEKILASHPDQSADQLTTAYQAILGRVPTAEEYQLGLDFLENQRQRYGSSPDGAESKSSTVASSDPALVDLCLVLLNSAEFLYVD